jgi:hypothetical protein
MKLLMFGPGGEGGEASMVLVLSNITVMDHEETTNS